MTDQVTAALIDPNHTTCLCEVGQPDYLAATVSPNRRMRDSSRTPTGRLTETAEPRPHSQYQGGYQR